MVNENNQKSCITEYKPILRRVLEPTPPYTYGSEQPREPILGDGEEIRSAAIV
jgi:hypothetical protein